MTSQPAANALPFLSRLGLPSGARDRKAWPLLPGSLLALAVTTLGRQQNVGAGPWLLITSDSENAARLEQEIAFFAGLAPDDGDSTGDDTTNSDDALALLSFPDWETLPYDNFSPHQDIVSRRLQTLTRLPTLQQGILVVPITTLLHVLPPRDWLQSRSFSLHTGQHLALDAMRMQLSSNGYRLVDTVYEHGDFAIRGSLLDIFPMGCLEPVRIELFDDNIETLRHFDPETQRSTQKLDKLELLPAREIPLDKDSIKQFRQAYEDTFDSNLKQNPLYQDISQGLASAGIEYYLPLFFQQTATLFDYLPTGTRILMDSGVRERLLAFQQEVDARYEQYRHDRQRPILPPQKLFLSEQDFFTALKPFARAEMAAEKHHDDCPPLPSLAIDHRHAQPLHALSGFCLQAKTATPRLRLLLAAESAGRREALAERLQREGIAFHSVNDWQDFLASDDDPRTASVTLHLTTATLERSFWLPHDGIAVIAESALFGAQVMQRRRRRNHRNELSPDLIIRDLSELAPGKPVVHIDHGVGRYQGLITLDVEGETQEFVQLEYADNARLYVPVTSLQLIARYSGTDDAMAPLHRLGTDHWSRARRKAEEQVYDVAAELLHINARRAARKGRSFHIDEHEYALFSAGFPFEETLDQALAIDAVLQNLRASQPMDRLVCGDVGFGKTEVAMRAAFVAVQDGTQVAILVPTTLLAQQHYESFRDRFADWPVRVEVLSRFKSGKEQQQALKAMAEGKIDIIIGTHKLLQPDVHFRNLGLLIVDEEHRFGVKDKETLKKLRADVDMLTLTATPIPRTLNMALNGIRDLSVIATPPARRLSIKTFVRESKLALVKEAILRELLRGGQVYYLHNDVKTIEKCAQELIELVPEARVAIAHGQMRERELEQVMTAFYHKQHNVLVCSTIIETGIDVPNANTILMDRADKLGLAQLHQLRGRVGRSHHQAYCYLLTPNKKAMTDDAQKRLEAIESAQDLGAGFYLASHDLEIRGAGEILGEEQSGNMQSVGFSLYMEMLERAVKAIRSGKTPNLDQPLFSGTDVNLRIPALIPESYLPDVHSRLILYKRISNADSNDALDELQVEMVDRFGLLPDASKQLFRQTRIKLLASQLGIRKIDAGAEGGRLEFSADTRVDPLRLVKLVQSQYQRYKLEGADRLRFRIPSSSADERMTVVEGVLRQLSDGS